MEHARIITGINSQLRLPAMLLEEIVNHRTRRTNYHYPVTGIERSLYCSDLDTILSYSIETTIKGNLQIEAYNNHSGAMELIHVPVTSAFLVTCIKKQGAKYKMEFGTSLN